MLLFEYHTMIGICSLLCRTTHSTSLMDSISHRGEISLWPSTCGGSWRVEWPICPSSYPTGEMWIPRALRAVFSLTNEVIYIKKKRNTEHSCCKEGFVPFK